MTATDDDDEMPLGQPSTTAASVVSSLSSEDDGEVRASPHGPRRRRARRHARRPPGRQLDPIWINFERIENGHQHKRAKCRHCPDHEIEHAKPNDNMLRHLAWECPSVPEETKAYLFQTRSNRIGIAQRMASLQRAPQLIRRRAQEATQVAASVQEPRVHPEEDTNGDDEPSLEPIVDQDVFELELARVFHLCALSFAVVESPVIQRFFKRLVPHFRLPPRNKLGGSLLTKLKAECTELVEKRVRKQKHVSIAADLWTNVKRSSIMNFMVVAPGMPPLLWRSLPTGSDIHDAAFIARELTATAKDIREKTGARVASLLGDNASAMLAGMSRVELTWGVFTCRCAAHVINLLVQDLCKIPLVARVRAKALAITVFVLRHPAAADHFLSLQGKQEKQRGLVTTVPTRWYTNHACMARVLMNKTALKKLFVPSQIHSDPDEQAQADLSRELIRRWSKTLKQRKKLEPIIKIIKDWEFWRDLKQVVELLDPIIDSLRVLESDKSHASQVYEEFRNLLDHAAYCADDTPNTYAPFRIHTGNDDEGHGHDAGDESDENPEDESSLIAAAEASDDEDDQQADLSLQARFYKAIDARWKYVHTDAMGIAFLLDPSKALSRFVDDDFHDSIEQARAFAVKSGMLERLAIQQERRVDEADFVAALHKLAEFKTTITTTQRERLVKTTPRTWWATGRLLHPLLGELADLVFAIPTSSAACERSFSIQDFVHRKKRNRLSSKKSGDLTYCYINFGTLWRETHDLARIHEYPQAFEREEVDDAPVGTPPARAEISSQGLPSGPSPSSQLH